MFSPLTGENRRLWSGDTALMVTMERAESGPVAADAAIAVAVDTVRLCFAAGRMAGGVIEPIVRPVWRTQTWLPWLRELAEADTAHAGLADSYLILGAFGISTLSPKEAFPRAQQAAVKALEIDDGLAEAHTSLALSLAYYDWNWSAAEREFKRSIELKPGYATAHHWYAFIYLTAMGRLDEAIAEMKQAQALEPLSLAIDTDLGFLLYLTRRYDQAIDEYQKTIEIDPSFVYTHWKLGLAYEQKAMYDEAIAELNEAVRLSARSAQALVLLGHAYAVSENRDAARAVLGELHESSRRSYVSPYRIAAIYVGLGESEPAFAWLERAYVERDAWLVWLKVDPVLDPIRHDPRFHDLLRRVGLAR